MKFKFRRPVWEASTEGTPAPAPAPAPAPVEPAAPVSLIGSAPAPAPAPSESAPAPAPVVDNYAPLTLDALPSIFPEGTTVEEARSQELLDAINSGASRADIAKNLLGLYQQEVEKFQTAQAEVWTKTLDQWTTEIKSAPEFSGDKLAPALGKANEMANALGGPEFVKLLDITGMGSNIHCLKALLKAAELIPQEGKPAAGNPAAQPKSLADRIFDGKK